MAMMATRKTRTSWIGAVAALACIAFGARTLIAQTQTRPQRSIVYTTSVPAPLTLTADDDLSQPDPLVVIASVQSAQAIVLRGFEAALVTVPAVPWNHHGLARTFIDLDAMRFDEARELYVVDLDNGEVAILTLNPRLQDRLVSTLARYEEPAEGVVALDPATGAVLAIVDDGAASIGEGAFTREARTYAASTFKVMTAAALFDAGAVTPQTTRCYSGGSRGFDIAALQRAYTEDDSCLTMTEAMGWSTNLVFAQLADQHLTPASLQEMAERFGFNADIPFEAPIGRSVVELPVDDRLEFARAAAGFRHSMMSPLHGALIQAAIANDGEMMVPTLVASIEREDGSVRYTHRPTMWRRSVSPVVAGQLETAQSTTCRIGTARSDFSQRDGWPDDVSVFGKTGTLSNRAGDGSAPDPLYLYRWFTGVGSAGDRQVAVAGLTVTTELWWIKGTYLASEAVLHGVR
ncbi:MAG: peptidoglycan glycosyltransferase [Bradymonadia bacterium]|jgi:peptidoglycan glycosyltransferase